MREKDIGDDRPPALPWPAHQHGDGDDDCHEGHGGGDDGHGGGDGGDSDNGDEDSSFWTTTIISLLNPVQDLCSMLNINAKYS